MGDEQVRDIGEFGLIARLTRDLATSPAVSVGPGDDGAVFLINGSAVVSTDMLVEGTHFRLDWSSGHDVGRKAVAVNVADLEAMGAEPVTLVVAIAVRPDTEVQWVREFATGLNEEAHLAGVAVVGGDTVSGPVITVSVSATGQLSGRQPLMRSGAQAGEVVALKGRLGWASAGLAVLGRGFRSPRAVVEAQRVPAVPYGAGRQAALAGATSMIDISDGLVADLGHIATASQVVINLDTSHLDVPEPLQAVAAATGRDPLQFILAGGEDHALVGTFPATRVPDDWQVIGRVSEVDSAAGEGQVLVDGQPWDSSAGWDHFRR